MLPKTFFKVVLKFKNGATPKCKLTIVSIGISITAIMPVDRKSLPSGVDVSLTPLEESGDTIRYPISEVPAYIGSGTYADVLVRGEGVAENHARLSWIDNSLYVENLGQGPTLINDREVKRSRLQNGDIMEVGDTKLLVQLSVPSGIAGKAGQVKDDHAESADASPQIWAAGFTSSFREWFNMEMVRQHGGETQSFRTGEEVLISMSRALSEKQMPDVLVLDLKLPIINGINVAIATRAYELGFNKSDHLPLVFLFQPPASSSFDKVLKFCQPVTLIEPHGPESVKQEVDKLAQNLKNKKTA